LLKWRRPYILSGFPGRECQIREALSRIIGEKKSHFFFDKLLEYFFTESDVKFFKSLGLNCIRLPFNYHHFEDDLEPKKLKEEGFKHLDRVIDLCAQYGIWTVLDLHAVPGGQNQGWHSDNPTHHAAFWNHRDFQDRVVWLWQELAKRYKDNVWVAGYNPMNEPADSLHHRLVAFYHRVYSAIRSIDSNHILFLDGNTFAADFSKFGDAYKNWNNTVYSIHDYSGYGFPSSPEVYNGDEQQKRKLKEVFERKRGWMIEHNLAVWNGEWGPVYARKQFDGEATEEINRARFRVLKDQLKIYDEARLSWSIWLFKDVDGFQGMIYSSPESAYSKLFEKFLAKKHYMAIDTWGTDDSHVKHIYEPLENFIKTNIDEKYQKLYPSNWTLKRRVAELSRHILVADFLVDEWAEHFLDKSYDELDELARSFSFENCVQRDELNRILKEFSSIQTPL